MHNNIIISSYYPESLVDESIDSYPDLQTRQASGDYYIDVTALLDFKRWSQFLEEAAGSRIDALNKIQKHYGYIFNVVRD